MSRAWWSSLRHWTSASFPRVRHRRKQNPSLTDLAPGRHSPAMIALPWTAPSFTAMKGIIHEPSTKPTMKPASQDALLTAIGKARGWIGDIRLGRIASFAVVAEREAVGERHIRLLD